MNHPEYIYGNRVRLRPATTADKQPVWEALAFSDLTETLLGRPGTPDNPALSWEDFCEQYPIYFFDDSELEEGRSFIIEMDKQAIGHINYKGIDRDQKRTELDIWLFAERYCGLGYGTDALNTLCEHLAGRFDLEGFFIKIAHRNLRALQAYEKAGFTIAELSDDEALAEFGYSFGADTVFMVKKLDRWQ